MCSITDALSIVGDRYALLVARELRYGRTRFQDIAAGTGAPRDVLTARGWWFLIAVLMQITLGLLLSERGRAAVHAVRVRGREVAEGEVVVKLRSWRAHHTMRRPGVHEVRLRRKVRAGVDVMITSGYEIRIAMITLEQFVYTADNVGTACDT